MHKSWFVILLSSLPFLAQAQKGEWQLGLEGGVGQALISVGVISGLAYQSEPGVAAGIGVGKSFGKHFSIISGITYEERKASLKIEERDEFNDVVAISKIGIDISYLTLPILARLSFGKKLRGFVNAGFGAEYLTHEKTTLTGPFFETVSIRNVDAEKKWFLVGFMYGAGVSYRISPKFSTSVEMRNNAGMFSIGDAFGANQIGLNSLNLLLGFQYRWSCTKSN